MHYWNDEIINKIRKGYYSAVYFNRTKYILEQEKNYKNVTMQIFQKNEGSILCGVEEVLGLLKVGTGYWEEDKWISKFDELEVKALSDGDKISAGETVMHISGPYVYFAHLESLYLGILARRTMVATNTRKVVDAAGGKPFGKAQGKPVIFFADRFDHFLNQEGDGYAAHVGGAVGVCTQAHTAWWKGQASGTIPHALIAINNSDTVKAMQQFVKYFSPSRSNFVTPGRWPNGLSCKELLPGGGDSEVKAIALVDFDNDCVKTSLQVAKALKDKLWGVRLDTAETLIDKSLTGPVTRENFAEVGKDFSAHLPNSPQPLHGIGSNTVGVLEKLASPQNFSLLHGVNPTLVRLVRNALDKEGFKKVKIIVSGGFNVEKIRWFEKEKTPVDMYGVGSALVHGSNDFTADVVMVEEKQISKVGREFKANNRLKNIT